MTVRISKSKKLIFRGARRTSRQTEFLGSARPAFFCWLHPARKAEQFGALPGQNFLLILYSLFLFLSTVISVKKFNLQKRRAFRENKWRNSGILKRSVDRIMFCGRIGLIRFLLKKIAVWPYFPMRFSQIRRRCIDGRNSGIMRKEKNVFSILNNGGNSNVFYG